MSEFKEEKKDRLVNIRLTQTEYHRLDLEASKRHITASALVRKLINNLYYLNHQGKLQTR